MPEASEMSYSLKFLALRSHKMERGLCSYRVARSASMRTTDWLPRLSVSSICMHMTQEGAVLLVHNERDEKTCEINTDRGRQQSSSCVAYNVGGMFGTSAPLILQGPRVDGEHAARGLERCPVPEAAEEIYCE